MHLFYLFPRILYSFLMHTLEKYIMKTRIPTFQHIWAIFMVYWGVFMDFGEFFEEFVRFFFKKARRLWRMPLLLVKFNFLRKIKIFQEKLEFAIIGPFPQQWLQFSKLSKYEIVLKLCPYKDEFITGALLMKLKLN